MFSGHRFAREFGQHDRRPTQRRSRREAGSDRNDAAAATVPTPAQSARIAQRPWKQFSLPYEPIEILSADQVEAIHETALTILEEIGMKVLRAAGARTLSQAGADDRRRAKRVRFDRAHGRRS